MIEKVHVDTSAIMSEQIRVRLEKSSQERGEYE